MKTTIRDLFVVIMGAVVFAMMLAGEMDRRAQSRALMLTVTEFISTGPRFTLQHGLGLCERMRLMEVQSGREDPVDCDAIRHAMED